MCLIGPPVCDIRAPGMDGQNPQVGPCGGQVRPGTPPMHRDTARRRPSYNRAGHVGDRAVGGVVIRWGCWHDRKAWRLRKSLRT